MQIKIYHRDQIAAYADQPGGVFEHVANFEADDALDIHDALEAAWVASQNIHGSWSKGPRLPDPHGRKDAYGEPVSWRNDDYRAAIEVVAPLVEHEGQVYGHRSSSVGDVFVIGERRFYAAGIGFEEEGVLKAFEVFLLEPDKEAALVWSGEALNRYAAQALARKAAKVSEEAHLYAVAQ